MAAIVVQVRKCYLSKWCLNRGFLCFRGLNESRCYISSDSMWQTYNECKTRVEAKVTPQDIPPSAIFANNETALGEVEVYGFDYDYTLASYKPALHNLIYTMASTALVSKLKYPEQILDVEFDPKFAERGLHFDIHKGLLLKIDSYHHIQLGTVYRGCQPVSNEEVKAIYDGTHIRLDSLKSFYDTGSMHQLLDLFAVPEITLISNVIEACRDVTSFYCDFTPHILQYLNQQNKVYDPEYVFYDVRSMVQDIHLSGELHEAVLTDIAKYLDKAPELRFFFEKLLKAHKQLFLISNSGFPFIDAGMKYLIGDDWRDMFNVIIVNARKPKFFNGSTRPFRLIKGLESDQTSWDRVERLVPGEVYQQGNFYLFRQMTGWFGPKVLYFGDHVYTDLADPSLRHGWKTGAIIPELEEEITMLNRPEYKSALMWSIALQDLIHDAQVYDTEGARAVVRDWIREVDDIRAFTKNLFNPQFGSIFRTHHNPTFFTRRLSRFADIYTSKITNLLQYSVAHTFYQRRAALPHEAYPRY